jgi:hypothetical protein
MKRTFALGVMLLVIGTGLTAVAQEKNPAKEALQELNDFIGEWNSAGSNVSTSAAIKGLWKEKLEWGWRFKGDDAWMAVKFTDSKLYKEGELKYDVKEKKYVLTLVGVDGKSRDYKGDLKKGRLDLDAINPETKETNRVSLTTAAEGIRFLYYVDRKAEGATIWVKEYKGEANKVGESLGKAEKKNLCIVTGGLGTSTVSHKGVTYYVCCSGCRDAFNENPEKYIKEWEAKMKKKTP